MTYPMPITRVSSLIAALVSSACIYHTTTNRHNTLSSNTTANIPPQHLAIMLFQTQVLILSMNRFTYSVNNNANIIKRNSTIIVNHGSVNYCFNQQLCTVNLFQLFNFTSLDKLFNLLSNFLSNSFLQYNVKHIVTLSPVNLFKLQECKSH